MEYLHQNSKPNEIMNLQIQSSINFPKYEIHGSKAIYHVIPPLVTLSISC